MVRILVFGASITYGAWDKEGGCVQRLRKFLDEKTLTDPNFYCIIYNLGISGDTTEDLLERFEFETKQRLKEEEKTIIIFAIGTNDSQFIHSQNSLRHSPQKFQNNLQKLVNLARKFSSKIIFVGLTPVDELKVDPIPWDTDKSYKNEYIQKYNEIIKSVCKKNKIYFIEILEKFVKLDYKDLLEDGLHPNSKGHQEIFEIVKDYLIQNKII
jgi:lysophospholipase L1-like esterase